MSARPGRIIDLPETGWPRDRDSRVVADPRFGALTARLWGTLREEAMKLMGPAPRGMIAALRLLLVAGLLALLEVACRSGWVAPTSVVPPTVMAASLWGLLAAGTVTADLGVTLLRVALAAGIAATAGLAFGLLLYARPRLHRAVEPVLSAPGTPSRPSCSTRCCWCCSASARRPSSPSPCCSPPRRWWPARSPAWPGCPLPCFRTARALRLDPVRTAAFWCACLPPRRPW